MSNRADFPYAKPSIDEVDRQAVTEVLKTDQLTRGPHTEAFEQGVANYCGALFAVSFNSATSAFHAAYAAAGIGPFDQIVTTPNTFIGTVAGGVQRGARLSLFDIEATTGNLNLERATRSSLPPISRGRHVLVPVHYRGSPVDMAKLVASLGEANSLIVEDGAQALGARYQNGQPVGNCKYSDMTVFSFHPAKSITAAEGGMVTTNDCLLAERLRRFRNNGIHYEDQLRENEPWHYTIDELSGNFHMTEIQAALGLTQLKRLDDFTHKRRQLALRYRQNLADCKNLSLLDESSDERSAHNLFVVRIDFASSGIARGSLMRALREEGIHTQVHFMPLYLHKAITSHLIDYCEGAFEETEKFYAEALSLPLYYELELEHVDHICDRLRSRLQKQ